MSLLAIVLSSLTGTSLLVTLALAIAWQRFGREPHAALWAAGFLASSIGYGARLVAEILPADAPAMALIGIDGMIAGIALIALGFRRRGGLAAPMRPVIVVAVTVATGVALLGIMRGDERLPRIVFHLFSSACMAVSALAVRDGRRGSHAPRGAMMRMLIAIAACDALLAGVAAALAPVGPLPPSLYGAFVLITVPVSMTAVGLGALLLLGGDLAERLYRLAEIDPLTGLLNRRGIERAATRLVAQATRGGRALSVVVADLDRFKAINDGFGHTLGDLVLRRFADHAAQIVRAGDLVGRLGGEEFVFVLTDTGATRAAEVMNRLRAGLGDAIGELGVPILLTASFGIAALADRGDTLDMMISRADEALYRSKDSGRDRISFAEPGPAAEPRFRAAWRGVPDDDERILRGQGRAG